MGAMTDGGDVLELETRGVIAADLRAVSAGGKVAHHGDGARSGVRIVVLVLALVLDAALVDHAVVDDDSVARLNGVVSVRFVRGGGRKRSGAQVAVLGLAPESITNRESISRTQLPVDARRSIGALARVGRIHVVAAGVVKGAVAVLQNRLGNEPGVDVADVAALRAHEERGLLVDGAARCP